MTKRNIREKTTAKTTTKTASNTSTQADILAVEAALIEAFKNRENYYNLLNYVSDEQLLDYYAYLVKAEDERISYLRRLLIDRFEGTVSLIQPCVNRAN